MGTISPGDGQDLIDRYLSAWQRGDVDAAMALFNDDAEYRADPFEPPLVAANAIRAFLNDAAATQAHIDAEAERVWVSGNTILCSWHGAVTTRATGDRTRVRGFMTMELDDDGLITRFKGWSLSRSVGIDSTFKPDPDSPAEVTRGR